MIDSKTRGWPRGLALALLGVVLALAIAGCGGDSQSEPPVYRHALGESDAPVTVVTYDDFQ